jgi:biopolymer transport protein ExbD
MRLRSKLKSVELDMTPMIDVVFLLIVFFTLVINFAAADQDERVKLPVSELAQPPESPPTEPITLHLLAGGNVIFNGKEYPIQELKEPLEHPLRILKYTNTPIAKATVIVRADARCESRQVLDVIELCQGLELTRFVLRTKQKEE